MFMYEGGLYNVIDVKFSEHLLLLTNDRIDSKQCHSMLQAVLYNILYAAHGPMIQNDAQYKPFDDDNDNDDDGCHRW